VADTGEEAFALSENLRYAKKKSVGMSETYKALALGLNAEIVFELADYADYSDETKLKYNDELYRILRTYRNGHRLEIVVTRDNHTED